MKHTPEWFLDIMEPSAGLEVVANLIFGESGRVVYVSWEALKLGTK